MQKINQMGNISQNVMPAVGWHCYVLASHSNPINKPFQILRIAHFHCITSNVNLNISTVSQVM